jgi:hypothetical protein
VGKKRKKKIRHERGRQNARKRAPVGGFSLSFCSYSLLFRVFFRPAGVVLAGTPEKPVDGEPHHSERRDESFDDGFEFMRQSGKRDHRFVRLKGNTEEADYSSPCGLNWKFFSRASARGCARRSWMQSRRRLCLPAHPRFGLTGMC